jgi:hypothetical protein
MSDIVSRLEACKFGLFWPEARDAIAEIERLQKELETARGDALEEAARFFDSTAARGDWNSARISAAIRALAGGANGRF